MNAWANECAKAQAALAMDSGFLMLSPQSGSTRSCACFGVSALIAWLAPRHLGDAPFLPAIEEYRRILNAALARQDLLDTLLAEQVILEGLGEVILTRIEEGLIKRAAPFGPSATDLTSTRRSSSRIRLAMLERAMAEGRIDAETLRCRAQDYLALTDRMILTVSDLFESIAEDPTVWAQDVQKFLPPWLTEVAA